GPSSVMAALSLAGLPTDRFMFAGFLPSKTVGRKKELRALAQVPATLVFLESAKRLPKSLADLAEVLGPRQAAVARELTKKFEEVRRGPLDVLAAHYAEAGSPRGEVTLVVAPPAVAAQADDREVDRQLAVAMQTSSLRDAASQVAAATGHARRDVYARALHLAQTDKA
ncbi:MAG: SAM-dependent methyltransferase, partial [Rhodospirillales bacterium]|nr:SAM-dependent methyltransferase [Rhodospirillales bacterium]